VDGILPCPPEESLPAGGEPARRIRRDPPSAGRLRSE